MNGYLALVTAAAQDLVKQRYLLEDDVDNVVKRADEHWSLLFANERSKAASHRNDAAPQRGLICCPFGRCLGLTKGQHYE